MVTSAQVFDALKTAKDKYKENNKNWRIRVSFAPVI